MKPSHTEWPAGQEAVLSPGEQSAGNERNAFSAVSMGPLRSGASLQDPLQQDLVFEGRDPLQV